ncbi:hypothetical protein CPB85DRAFT_1257434 [Mucidula mucida]|nr:hypothetical protein CPB85DRAFT_1257434 [Mucidula mucida]
MWFVHLRRRWRFHRKFHLILAVFSQSASAGWATPALGSPLPANNNARQASDDDDDDGQSAPLRLLGMWMVLLSVGVAELAKYIRMEIEQLRTLCRTYTTKDDNGGDQDQGKIAASKVLGIMSK